MQARAQSADEAFLKTQYQQGLAALNAGDVKAAIVHLDSVYAADPGYRGMDGRSAAYWLGGALANQKRHKRAAQVWRDGGDAFTAQNPHRIELYDQYVLHVFRQQLVDHYTGAVNRYLSILQQMGRTPQPRTRSILQNHAVLVEPILPKTMREEFGWDDMDADDRMEDDYLESLEPADGNVLTAWLRGLDPTPATLENERLEVHLRRMVVVRNRFGGRGRLDDRARVFMRFGEPTRISEIPHSQLGFLTGAGRYKGNAIWVYREVTGSPCFFFGEAEAGYYAIMNPSEFLPANLRSGVRRRAVPYMRAMEVVYRHLSMHHPDYMDVYADIGNAIDEINLEQIAPGSSGPSRRRPSTMASSLIMDIEHDEDRIAERRREDTPRDFVEGMNEGPSLLPIQARSARFLTESGVTRTELYWGAPARALHILTDDDEASLLMNSLRVTNASYDENSRQSADQVVVPREYAGTIVETIQTRTDQPLFSILAQWEHYAATLDNRGRRVDRMGDRFGRRVVRMDSLRALDASGEQVEMSDLKPVAASPDSVAAGMDLRTASPYPFHAIQRSTPVALYFEVYHLQLREDGTAEYTVDYSVQRASDGEALTTETATAITNTATTSRATESIVLDLPDDFVNESLDVTVRVTDTTTGQSVERTIDFDLVD